MAEVRSGVIRVVSTAAAHFRSNPGNGHPLSQSACLKRASNGLMQRSKYSGYSITSGERYCIWGSQLAGSAAGGGERHEDLQEQLKPPNGGVFLRLNGIVIKSHGGFGTEGFADAINLG